MWLWTHLYFLFHKLILPFLVAADKTYLQPSQPQTRWHVLVLTCSGNVADLFPTYPLTTWLWMDSTRHSITATTPRGILISEHTSTHTHTMGDTHTHAASVSPRAASKMCSRFHTVKLPVCAAAVKGRSGVGAGDIRGGVTTASACLLRIMCISREQTTVAQRGQTGFSFPSHYSNFKVNFPSQIPPEQFQEERYTDIFHVGYIFIHIYWFVQTCYKRFYVSPKSTRESVDQLFIRQADTLLSPTFLGCRDYIKPSGLLATRTV